MQTSLLEARLVAGSRRLFATLRERVSRRARRAGVLQGQAARAGAAPRQASGQRLQPRAEPQGSARRPARPAGRSCGSPRRAASATTGATWRARGLHHPRAKRASSRGTSDFLQDLRIRLHYLAGRREDRLAVRPPERARARNSATRPPRRKRASEQLDAALLPHRQGDHAAQHHPAAEPRRARSVPREDAPPQPINERFQRRATSCSTRATTTSSSASPHAILESFLLLQQHPRAEGHDRAPRCARCGARGRASTRAFRARPGQPRDCSSRILQQPRGIMRELRRMNQYGDARPLHPGVRPHRRPDAARPVPRLHGRPAHPHGGAQPAPLHHARVRARVPALQPADRRLRRATGCSTSPRSSTTSPRAAAATTRRWARSTRAFLPRSTACRRRTPSWSPGWSSTT